MAPVTLSDDWDDLKKCSKVYCMVVSMQVRWTHNAAFMWLLILIIAGNGCYVRKLKYHIEDDRGAFREKQIVIDSKIAIQVEYEVALFARIVSCVHLKCENLSGKEFTIDPSEIQLASSTLDLQRDSTRSNCAKVERGAGSPILAIEPGTTCDLYLNYIARYGENEDVYDANERVTLIIKGLMLSGKTLEEMVITFLPDAKG